MFHLQSDQYRKCNVWTPIHEIEKSHAEMQSVAVNNKVPLMRRKKHKAWIEEEHKLFLEGLERYGKGAWKSIARNVVRSRTPSQIASHAQKYFLRNYGLNPKKRGSIHDITLQSIERHNPEPLMHYSVPQLQEKRQPQQNWVRVPLPTMQQYVDPLSWVSNPAVQRPESLPHHVDWVSLPNLQLQGLPNLVNQAHVDPRIQLQYYPLEEPHMQQLSSNHVPPLGDPHMHGLVQETEQLYTPNNNVVVQDIVDKEKWVLNYMQQLLQEIKKPPETLQLNPANKYNNVPPPYYQMDPTMLFK